MLLSGNPKQGVLKHAQRRCATSIMEYFDLVGNYALAYDDVLRHGGQFYPGNGKDSANVVVRGKQCFTYWEPNSKRKAELKLLCDFLNISSEGQTGGRVARWLVDSVLNLPYQQTFWQRKYRKLAMCGNHWHYTFVVPKQRFIGIEVDLKSAYFNSLIAGKSLLFQDGKGYIEDNNSLEIINGLMPSLPKWFRLQLLGVLSSWRFFFYAKDKGNKDSKELKLKRFHKINYNAAFNATHRAILRNYKIMQRVHQIGGEHIKRMHTDSFFLELSCPEDVENQIWDYLKGKECVLDIKAAGLAYFFDLNTGFVGGKFVGSKIDVVDLMRQNDIKMKKQSLLPEVLDRFGAKIEQSTFKDNYADNLKTSKEEEFYQQFLFDTQAYVG